MMNHNEKRGAETQHRGLSHTKNNVTDWIQLSCDTTWKMNAAAWRSSLVEAPLRF
ncbi:unnamed protein product [Brassica rapa subsp. trilocularis]